MMKIALVVLASLVLLSAAVVIIGFLLPKQHVVSRSASFHTSPDRLYSLIAGPQNWRPDVVRYEAVPNPAGSELFSETTKNGETVTYQVTDRNPPVSVTRRIATQGLPYSGSWTFSLEPGHEVTVVRITERGEVFSPVFRFVSRFVLGHTHGIDAYLQALGKAAGEQIDIKD